MNRRGFALLTALWLTTALATFAGVALSVARLGALTTRNRVLLARAGWAREACLEILLARYAREAAVRAVDTVELGRGTWCRVDLDDPAARLSLNTADSSVLRALLVVAGRRRLVDAVLGEILVRRRSGTLHDVRAVPGLDAYADLLTTRGTGLVNVNLALEPVLRALPGFDAEAVRAVLDRRSAHRLIASVDELGGLLSPSSRSVLVERYPDVLRMTSFGPTQLVAYAVGGVRGTPLVARATVTVVPLPERLAVIRREVE